MATIDECKNLLQYRATKSGYNGNLSPNDFNLIWGRAEQRYFNTLYKQFQIDQKNVDSLIKFKTPPLPIDVGVNGSYLKPNSQDILHIDSIRHDVGEKQVPVTRVNDDRLASYLDSEYDAPTALSPIYVEYDTYIQFYPKNLINATLVYLKKLTPAKWNYTLVSGRPVYSSGGSVQPLWSDTDIDEIIYLCGVDLGLNLRDQTVLQVNDIKAKENA